MLGLDLAEGQRTERLFGGYVRTEDELREFLKNARTALTHGKGQPLLFEIWESTPVEKREPQIPIELEEAFATYS